MPELKNLIKANPQKSTVDIICEANTSHITKVFAVVEVKGAFVTEENSVGRNVNDPHSAPPMLNMRVCPICMVEYLSFINNVCNSLAKL